MGRDFYVPWFSVTHIPFFHFTEGCKEPERLKALLFYVHHAQWLEQINDKLEEAGCRPMTANELKELFHMQEGILAQVGFRYILATGVPAVTEGKGKKVAAVECRDDGDMRFVEALSCVDCLPDHSGIYVAAVKKE